MTNQVLLILALLALMAGVLGWVARANRRDLAALAQRLGLRPVTRGARERAPDPVRGWSIQSECLAGTLHGLPVRVWIRTVRRYGRRSARDRSHFTVLSVEVPQPSLRFRLEPARTGAVGAAFGGQWPAWALGDPAFDEAFRLSTPEPLAVRALLGPEARQRWLALRTALTGTLGQHRDDTALGRFAGDLLTGTLVLDHGRLEYAAMGTVTPGMIEHLARAAPEVVALARRLGATGPG